MGTVYGNKPSENGRTEAADGQDEEITAEMLEAGAIEVVQYDPQYDFAEDVARAAYLAMCAAKTRR